jgi:transcriptional regulator with XRE-family HTH domain
MNRDERRYYKNLRQNKDIKLREVADHLGCSISWISQFERCKVNFTPEMLKAYKKYISETNNTREIIIRMTI